MTLPAWILQYHSCDNRGKRLVLGAEASQLNLYLDRPVSATVLRYLTFTSLSKLSLFQ